jgi:hypothetical protein
MGSNRVQVVQVAKAFTVERPMGALLAKLAAAARRAPWLIAPHSHH